MDDASNLSKSDESTSLINEDPERKDPEALLTRMKYISDLITKVSASFYSNTDLLIYYYIGSYNLLKIGVYLFIYLCYLVRSTPRLHC